jgi:hypothetical protein
MSTVKIRNVNPLGYVDLPLIGRVGPAPYLVCHDPENCHDEHEHTQVVDEEHGQPDSGCLVPGEVFEVSNDPVDALDGRSVADVLLAQVGNYELVKTSAKKAADAPTTEEV